MSNDIEAALERCAEELPDYFEVYIEVENGAVSVRAASRCGYGRYRTWEKDGDYSDHSVPERILIALEWAKEQAND